MASTPTEVRISISIYRGWIVTTAAALSGLVLGILYVWSVVRAGIPASWGWSKADMALPVLHHVRLLRHHHDPGRAGCRTGSARASPSSWEGCSRASAW